MPLTLIERLAAVPHVVLVSVQVRRREDGHSSEPLPPWIVDVGLDPAAQNSANVAAADASTNTNKQEERKANRKRSFKFRDTAAVLEAVDLLISSDTAVGHLGAAMGVPTWLLVHRHPDWRWDYNVELVHAAEDGSYSCAWYPTARVFRQLTSEAGSYEGVLERVEASLTKLIAAKRRAEEKDQRLYDLL